MPAVLGTIELLSAGTLTMVLFGLSSMGFGLFLGRILFSAPGMAARAAVSPDFHPPSYVSASTLDLRASPRTPVAQTKILVSPTVAPAEQFEGWITDRSLGGLGLSVLHPVEIGTILLLTPDQGPEWVSSHYLEVRYCRLHRGRWRLGCQYVDGE